MVSCLVLFLATPAQGYSDTIADYQSYMDFFEEVYETMDKNYYLPVRREIYEAFIQKFNTKLFQELQQEGKSKNYILWRSASYLVEDLKSPDDTFSAFFPPKPAKAFAQEALGKRVDLGIGGKLTMEGFVVTNVEPRSDAYLKGLRVRDIILKIDDVDFFRLTQKMIEERLTPLEGSTVKVVYLARKTTEEKMIEVVSEEYFKQTIFMLPVDIPGIYCLQIQKFNRKTSEDLLNYLNYILTKNDDKGLILDLRDNPGGPPLAAREIAAFFLPPGEDFAYFQKRGHPKSVLDVPKIPQRFHYGKPMVILINEKSGSASELFTGVMQKRQRAFIMGINTAGKVFLKSMFNFEDDSMLLLVTGRGYYPDGEVFSFEGVTPNRVVTDEDLVRLAAEYLLALAQTKN